MPENADSITIDHIAPILFDELEYADPLTAKEFHKLVYLIHENLEETELDSKLAYFWYKFGSCAKTPGSSGVSITSTGAGYEATCERSPEEIGLTRTEENVLRRETKDALETYYSHNLNYLTDLNYEKAPYQVQRDYRELDQTLQSIKNELGPATTEFDYEGVRTKFEDVVSSFPVDDFPQHRNELFTMHSIVDRLLADRANVEKIIGVTDTFWSLFCLDLCQDTATNTTAENVLLELGIWNVQNKKNELRSRLNKYEADHITVQNPTEELDAATESLMASRLDFAGVSE